tara:strand:+ start:103 stop:675 length:573 start_codon:yes stop_codon:yes gene_type:complete
MVNITSESTKIYLVTNCFNIPNKVYIGKTINSRETSHKRTYGGNIIYIIIDGVNSLDSKDWKPLECFWIEQFRQWGFDVQNKNGGGGGLQFCSDETKLKMSISRQNLSKKTKNQISNSNKGKKFTEEHKLKISVSKQNISEETRSKISIGHIGLKHNDETKLIIRDKLKGSKRSEETKLKMSISAKARKR